MFSNLITQYDTQHYEPQKTQQELDEIYEIAKRETLEDAKNKQKKINGKRERMDVSETNTVEKFLTSSHPCCNLRLFLWVCI